MIAVADCQGFTVGNRFYIRELSLVSKDFIFNMEFDTGLRLAEMNKRDRTTVSFQKNNIHGLTLRPMGERPASNCAGYILKSIIGDLEVGCKNDEMVKLLKAENIPFVYLDAPKFSELRKKYPKPDCRHHFKDATCSLAKAYYLYNDVNK